MDAVENRSGPGTESDMAMPETEKRTGAHEALERIQHRARQNNVALGANSYRRHNEFAGVPASTPTFERASGSNRALDAREEFLQRELPPTSPIRADAKRSVQGVTCAA